jgi:hypothetical protein
MKKLNLNQKINKKGKVTETNQWPLKKRTSQIWEKKLLLPKAGKYRYYVLTINIL